MYNYVKIDRRLYNELKAYLSQNNLTSRENSDFLRRLRESEPKEKRPWLEIIINTN